MANSSLKAELPRVFIASIIGLGLMVFGVISIKNAMAAKKWPTVTGIITSSTVAADGTKYVPRISYAYDVDSGTYSSDKIQYSGLFRYKTKSAASTVASKYPVNSEVKVYYDPEQPDRSCLEPAIGIFQYLIVLIGLITAGVPLGGFVYSISKRPKGDACH
jgi:hypothetical protein